MRGRERPKRENVTQRTERAALDHAQDRPDMAAHLADRFVSGGASRELDGHKQQFNARVRRCLLPRSRSTLERRECSSPGVRLSGCQHQLPATGCDTPSLGQAVCEFVRRWPREYAFAAMTAKEKLLERAPHWSEEQAERALRAAENDGAVDGWGDLSKLHEVSTAETLRRLAKEEQAAGHEPW